MLGLGVAGGAVITVWALSHHALSHDNAVLAARIAAGHTFGLVVLVVVVLLLRPGTRRRSRWTGCRSSPGCATASESR